MTGSGYALFAPYYDGLMRGAQYEARADYFCEIFRRFSHTPKLGIDLACGTGSLTLALKKRGLDFYGVDASPEMLSKAMEKTAQAGEDILFLCQRLERLDLYGTVDAVVCCLDSINYLPSEEDVERTFSSVCRFLIPGGLFIFDVNTEKRFREKYGKNDFILENKNGLIAWSCDYKPRLGRCDFYLSCFVPCPDGRYVRRDEEQSEYCYSDKKLRAAAEKCGFEVLACYDRMALHDGDENSEKVHYILKKKNTEEKK